MYCNKNKSFQGTVVLGTGFILDSKEAADLIRKSDLNRQVIFPYLTGDDLNNSPNQMAGRQIINFSDWDENESKKYRDCYSILVEKVKPQRDEIIAKGKQIHTYNFWHYWDPRPNLYSTISKLKRVLVVNNHTRHCVFDFVDPRHIFSHALTVIAFEDYNYFSILSSNVFSEWAWKRGSTMGSTTLRFTSSEIFEPFPFPQNINPHEEQKLEIIGKAYHDHRTQFMLSIQLGLTKTYNAFHAKGIHSSITTQQLKQSDKKTIEKQYGKEVWNLWNHLQKTEDTCSIEEAIDGIVKLRELHVQMDNAVLEAYGWSDMALRHDFYEVDYLPENDRTRFTIHPDARKEVLKRLLELNHQIHEEEVKAGLWDKKGGKKKGYIGNDEVSRVDEPDESLGGLWEQK